MKLEILSILLALVVLQSCKREDESFCTEEFVTIGVTVTGKTLTKYYTVRKSTKDTIKIPQADKNSGYYPILNNDYTSTLKDKREYFYFIGEIDNEQVINETYLISANDCQIFKVNGKETIKL